MILTSIPLSKQQHNIMKEFYAIKKTKVIYNKRERKEIWSLAIQREQINFFDELKLNCPALAHQILKSYQSTHNIQSAVFSECVYAQTLANMFDLKIFVNCEDDSNFIPYQILSLINSYHLLPRYVYSNNDKSRMLIQAGGCGGIDSALITVIDLEIYTIEFKEPGAKTSEPDLPKYHEDGFLVVDKNWLQKYPQFTDMINEQIEKKLNFFEKMGSNINDFSNQSIKTAVSNNYTTIKKFADVICTEDADGYLTMIPTNQVHVWARLEGEIRPAGRNHYAVWTPKALKKFLCNAKIEGDIISINKEFLEERKERGGNKKVSGYKINPLFFVYLKDCHLNGNIVTFNINKVRQLNPTIAGKMFFNQLSHSKVKGYYGI